MFFDFFVFSIHQPKTYKNLTRFQEKSGKVEVCLLNLGSHDHRTWILRANFRKKLLKRKFVFYKNNYKSEKHLSNIDVFVRKILI